jgi:hypothetical protein
LRTQTWLLLVLFSVPALFALNMSRGEVSSGRLLSEANSRTFGPITFSGSRVSRTATDIAAEEAHERQHRWNFWTLDQFVTPCWKLEQWAFRQEISILQRRMDELSARTNPDVQEVAELNGVRNRLSQAIDIARYEVDAKGYCGASN